MSAQLPQLLNFSDHLSPRVVKEMRQGLRPCFSIAATFLAIREINRLHAWVISSDSTPPTTDAELA